MKYMLDTSTCVHVIKNPSFDIFRRFLAQSPYDLCISAITYAELMHGVEVSAARDRNRLALLSFLSPFTTLDFSAEAAEEYARIRSEHEGQLKPTELMIAAHALSEKLVLVTHDTQTFQRIKGLRLENWTEAM